jgi:hypothetical protein
VQNAMCAGRHLLASVWRWWAAAHLFVSHERDRFAPLTRV